MNDTVTNDAVQVEPFSGLLTRVPLILAAITAAIFVLAYYLKEPKLFVVTVLAVIIYYQRYKRKQTQIKYGFEGSLINISVFAIFLSLINIFIVIIIKIVEGFTK
ncbi:MAG: hypothetical protein PHW74_04995 [Desulfobacca sp.]|nr:hypothetical protein [Desulfobacca sp.]